MLNSCLKMFEELKSDSICSSFYFYFCFLKGVALVLFQCCLIGNRVQIPDSPAAVSSFLTFVHSFATVRHFAGWEGGTKGE